ncbi:MAG: hypothetical protein U0941_01535 [Planctomycetaceae bacterium]
MTINIVVSLAVVVLISVVAYSGWMTNSLKMAWGLCFGILTHGLDTENAKFDYQSLEGRAEDQPGFSAISVSTDARGKADREVEFSATEKRPAQERKSAGKKFRKYHEEFLSNATEADFERAAFLLQRRSDTPIETQKKRLMSALTSNQGD